MNPQAVSSPHFQWHQPAQVLAAQVGCGTTLANRAEPGFGSFNLATHVGDASAAIAVHRRELQAVIGVTAIQWLNQVHGCQVHHANSTTAALVPAADAVWTAEPGLAVAVLTADCLPVVLAARDGSCVGVAHAGWRGLVGGVLPALVAALPVPAAQLVAWGGPGIGVSAYEVGADVATAVRRLPLGHRALQPGKRQGKYQLNLQQLAALVLAAAGVSDYQASALCAFTDRRCYSYRRSGVTGRMATLAWLQPAG